MTKEYKQRIAQRISQEILENQLVSLGIGLPTMVGDYINNDNIILQSENGLLGLSKFPEKGKENYDLTNSAGRPVTMIKGGSTFDSALSFAIIRGGHVDVTVLGALQVDKYGGVSSWIVPNKIVPGMGGAMDLIVGSKKVIIAMLHTTKNGDKKIMNKCTLPYTAVNEVDMIVTELGVMSVSNGCIKLLEIFSDTNVEEVKSLTEVDLVIDDNLKVIEI